MFQLITETVPIAGFGSALILGLIIGLRHGINNRNIFRTLNQKYYEIQ